MGLWVTRVLVLRLFDQLQDVVVDVSPYMLARLHPVDAVESPVHAEVNPAERVFKRSLAELGIVALDARSHLANTVGVWFTVSRYPIEFIGNKCKRNVVGPVELLKDCEYTPPELRVPGSVSRKIRRERYAAAVATLCAERFPLLVRDRTGITIFSRSANSKDGAPHV
jgi:hypothetical protein